MEKDMYLATRRMEDRLWWYAGMRRISERLLDRYVGPGPLEILDAGCGTGGAMTWLARRGRVTGIDLSDLALAFSRQRDLKRLVRASTTQLPFPAHRFDVVTSFDVLYHQWVEDRAALAELARVLRPGGFALVRVAALDWLRGEHDRAGYTRHRYRRRELREKLEQAGLRVLAASYANALLFPTAVAKRLADRLDLGGEKNGRRRGSESAPAPSSTGDFWLPPAPINAALGRLLALEAALVSHSALPIGLSVFALAQKA